VAIPHWLSDGTRFWYRATRAQGADFVMVDPVRNLRRQVFDNARLAAAMSLANDTAYDPTRLPFTTFNYVDGEQFIEFTASAKLFRCGLASYQCTVGDTLPSDVLPPPSSLLPGEGGRREEGGGRREEEATWSRTPARRTRILGD
jgi:hypothetical protein